MADEDGQPGAFELSTTISKPGAYQPCLAGQSSPFHFSEVCGERFNIRPKG